MIYIYQEQFTNASASCTRNTDIPNPYFLWNMTHKLSGKEYNFIPYQIPYTTDYKPSYDLFNIGIFFGDAQVLTGATMTGETNVHLIPGEYFIQIHAQVSDENLNPLQSGEIVFQTLLNVVGTNQNIPVSYQGEEEVFIIYDPENEN